MPISDIRFQDGIFFTKQSGVVERDEAEAWVKAFQDCAAASPTPVVVLVDAREVESVTAAASLVFIEGSSTPNVKVSVIAAGKAVIRARTIGMMSEPHSSHETHVFRSWDEAERFAKAAAREG